MKKYLSIFLISYLILFYSSGCNKIFELDHLNLVTTISVDSVQFSSFSPSITCNAWIKGQILDISNLAEEKMIQHGHCWAKNPEPKISDNRTQLGVTDNLDSFVSKLESLEFDSTYFVRAYIQTNTQTIYGREFSFEVIPLNVPLAQITAISISNIEQNIATAISNLDSLGIRTIIDHGHCWNTQTLPTIENNLGINRLGSTNEKGIFNSNLNGLIPTTRYYVRPFTIDAKNVVVYGQEITFITKN